MAHPSQQATWKGKETEKGTTQEGVSKLFGDAQDKVQEVASMAKDFAGNIVEKAKDSAEDVTDLIGKYPGRSLLIGLGAGILMGVVFSTIVKSRA